VRALTGWKRGCRLRKPFQVSDEIKGLDKPREREKASSERRELRCPAHRATDDEERSWEVQEGFKVPQVGRKVKDKRGAWRT